MEMMQMDLGDAMGDSDSDTTVDMSNRQPSGMDTPPPREASPSLPQMEGYNPSDSFSDSSSNLLKPNFNSTHDDISKGNVIDFSSSLENTTSSGSGLLVPETVRRGTSSVLDSLLDQKLKSMMKKKKKGDSLYREQKADRSVDGKERGKDRCELSDVSDDDAIRHPQVDKESSECNSEEIMDFGEDEPLMLTSEDEYSGTDNLQNSDSHSKSRQTETIGPVGYSSRKRHDGGTKTTKHGAECNIAQHNLKDRSPTKPVANIMGRDPDMVLDDESMEALGADRPPSEYDSQEEEETTASWKREKESWMKEKKHMDETAAQQVTTKGEESEEDEDEEDDDEEEDDEEDEDEYEFFEDDDYDDEAIDSLIKGEADEDGTDTPKTVDGENADTEDEPSIKKRKRIVKKRKKKCDPDADDSGDDSEIGVGGKKKRRKKDKKKIKEEKEKEDEEKEEREKEKEGQRKGARKNIRKILTEDKLESATKDAQQEEFERKQRLQELRERLAYQQRVAEEGRSELKSLLEDEESDGKEDDIMVVSPNQAKKEERVEKGKGDEKGKKDEDVITLSSSDDDCKVVPSEPELEDEDDPDNSGLHVKDELNLPDEQGRVLVNLSHPPEEADIFLAPQLAAAVKPHQIGGIRFLYDNLVESVGRYKTSNGFGCILAHSMGLGKTIQLISFTDIFLRCTPAKTALVIVPVNTLQNWLHEFDMWLPHADSDTIKHAPPDMILPRKFEVFYINDSHKTPAARAEVVTKWVTDGGCLLMGYEMYRLLTSKKTLAPKPKRNKKNEIIDLEEEDKNKQRLHKIQEALLKPGPDLVICDEGHRIKNSHASISQALKNLKTKRRVVLTGYPLQNNLLEYWCMVDFVRPNYLGTKTEFSNMFERPIMNGQCVDSTPQDRKLMRYRSHVLHSLLSGFVQRRGHSVLKKALPPKEEHVIFVRMSPIQRQLYKAFMDSMQSESLQNMVSSNPLKAFSVCCKIWNHPDVLYNVMQARKEADEDDLDIGEELTPTPTTKKKGRGTKSSSRSSGASTPAPTPPLLPPANPMSQFGPVGGMGGRMNTPPWNQGINSYGGPGHNSQGMYGMGPMGNMGSMGMGQSGMHMGQYGRNGQMNYGPGGPMNMGQGMGPSMGQNMGPNGPMNMGQHGMGQNSAMNMGQQGMGQQDMGQQDMGQNMGQQSMDHSGVPKNPGAPMGMNMNASQNIGPHQEHDMASNDRQDIGSSGQHGQPNMGMNESQHMGPNGSQGMSPNGPQNMGSIGPNRPPSMGSNNSQNMGSNGPQCMDPNRSHGMGPNGPHSMGSNRGQNMGLNGAQNMGPNGPQNMGQNGPESMGSNGPQNMGPNGPQNMGPNGPQNMGPNGPQNMGPNGPQNMGPNGPQNMGPNGPQNMGHNVPQNMGPNGPQNMGPNGSQNMGPNGAQNIGPNGPQNMGANGPQSMGPNGPQNMGPNGPQNMGLNGPQNMGPNGPQNMGPNGAQGIGPNGPPNLCTNGPQNMGPNAPQTMGSGGHHSMGPSGSQNMEPSGPHNMGPNGPAIMDPNGPQNMGQNGPQNMRPNGPQGMGPNGPQGMGPNGPQGMGSGGSQNMSQNMGIGMNQNSQMNMGANGPQGMGSYNQMDPYNRSMGQYNQSMGMYGQPPMSGYNQSIGPYGKNSMMLSQSMDRNQMMGHMGPNRPGMEMPGQPVGPSGPYYGGPHNMGMSGPNSSLSGPGPMETHNQPPGPDISSGPPTEPPGPRHYGYYPKAVTPPSSTSTDSKTTTSKSDAALSTDTKKHVLAAGSPTKDLKPNMTTTTTTSSVGTTPTPSDDSKDDKSKIGEIKADDEAKETKEKKEPNEISYEWAEEILKTYKRGMMENGGKIVLLMALIEETLRAGDKILVFSQSLFTLNLIEEYLQRSRIPLPYPNNEYWARNRSYFRLDGSTSGTDRERLINQFNAYNNTNIHVFLLSTRAGCLGINLIGANRVVVLDASWNPCHDCQAVCRVYRYGQLKRCYVYRFVTDNTLEKKIYDRQINKQGMSDRVVDELQPQTNFTRNQVDTLLEYDDQDFKPIKPDKEMLAKFEDLVLKDIVNQYCSWITKPPFTHESLLIDKKEEKLTKTDKRLAKQGYEMEKKMNISYTRPSYSTFYQKDGAANRMPMAKQVTIVYKKTANGEVKQVICIPTRQPQIGNRPIASVRPMMSTPVSVPARSTPAGTQQGSIPVSSLLRPGVTVHQIQTTTDINIPSNAANNTGPQKIPAGETVLIIKTPKGVYIRTNNGKIFAVRSAPKGTEVTPGTPAPTGPMKLPAPSTATSPILQQTLTKSSDPGKVTTLSTKGVTDLLSGGSLLANQRKDGMKLISRERMQTLLQQGKIVTPKGMPITLISNPNMPMANMAKLGNPMGQKVPGGVRIIRPDKFASVQIAKAAAAAKAGVPNVDTKKEAAAIVADVLARYNENQVGQGGINPMVKIIRQDPKEEGAKTALVKDADGKLVIKTLPPGMNLKPIVKDDCVKPQLLKDIEMVREKEMAKGKEHMAITNDLNTSVDATKRLTQDAIRKLDMEPPEKTEKAPGDTANEPRNLTALANKDTLSIKDDVKAQQPTSPKEIQREKENIGQWSQDIPLHNKVDTLDKDPVPITVATTSATSTTNKDMTPQVTKAGTSLLNKDLPGDRRQERDTINGPMLWDQNTSMFRGSSSDSGGVDSTRQMSTSQMSNYTPSSQRSGGQYTMSSGGNINNYGSNQFDMNVQTSMATPASSGMDQQGTMERDSSYSNNQFMGNQEFMGRSSSNASSMSSSQFGAIGGAGSGAGSDTLSGAGSGSRSGNSANLQSVASSMSSGRAGDMNMTYSISGQSMDGQFPIRNQYNDPMSSMSQNMSNMDRPSDLMSRAMPTQTSVGNQMDIRRSDSIGSQSSIGSNSTTNIGSQFSMGGQPSGSLGSQSGLASQPPAMPGQFSNIGRDNIDKISANSMGSPSSMASQFSMGSQPTMSRSEMGNSQSSMGSTQNMGSPQNMGSMPSMGNSLNMGSTPSMVNSLNMGSTPSMGSSQSMRSTSNLGSSQNIGSSQSMGSTSSMGSSQSMSRSQSMGRPSSMDSQFPDLGRTGTSDSHFSMGGSSQPSSQQSMSMPSESLKCTDLSSTPRDYSRSSSANSQHTTKVEPRGMASTKEPSPAKRHESKSTDRSADRNTRPSSTTSSKAESLPHSSNQPMDWSSNHTSSSTSVNTPPKPTADSASSLLKEMVPPTTTQQPEHAPSYPSFSSSMSSPYGSTPGYSMPPIYPSHMGHSSGYGMSHHGLSPWYSGLSPWSAPPSYPGMAPTDAYAKHMSGSTPAMSSYPGMSGYSGYHGNAPGMVAPKDKDGDKDRLSLSTSRHGSSSKDSLDMAGSAFDMQSSNPLSAMSAMSGMSSMGSGPHSAAIGNRYHPQSSHSMQSGGMGSAYGAYPYHHMSPLSHPMYPPPPGGSSAYNYMSPYSGMPSTMMQHLPGSMPPLHPLSDMDPSRPPHMGP